MIRAYRITDNRLAELAGWDPSMLNIEFQDIEVLDSDFDLTLTGFEMGEIDVLLGLPPDETPETVEDPDLVVPAVTQLGDLWLIGDHRLICGDARDPDVLKSVMNGDTAQMVFTDPPYNVPISGHVCGQGKVQHREFAMASGEMSEEGFRAFLGTVLGNLASVSTPSAIHYVCMDWRHMEDVSAVGRETYAELKNLCVWAKTNAGMGSFYRSQHELVFVFKCDGGPHINNFGLGEHGRHRSNVWTYAGVNTFRKDRMEDLVAHPTVKPIQMVMDAVLDCSHRGGIVLDAFVGSGTTLLAAARTGRQGYGVEIDPHYVDLTLARLHAETGGTPILDATFETFDEVKTRRAEEVSDD